jgi:TonB family protein
MRRSDGSSLALVAALALAPRTVWSTSLATCSTADTTGLPGTWSARQHAQPEAGAHWRITGGDLQRDGADDFQPEGLDDFSATSVAFPSASRGFVVADDGTARQTMDGGAHWTPLELPGARAPRQVACTDEEHCWVVDQARGQRTRILRTTDGGTTWSASRVPVDDDLADVFFLDSGRGWAVGRNGTFLASRDGGSTWQHRPLALSDGDGPPSLGLVRFVDSLVGFVTSGDRLLRTTDGGRSWHVPLRLSAGLSFLAIAAGDGEVVAALEGDCSAFQEKGGNFRSTDDGASWADVVTPWESEHDWEARVQGTPDGPMSAVYTSVAWEAGSTVSVHELARGEAKGAVEREVSVERRSPCDDVTVQASTQALEAELDDWVGADLCRVDPDEARAAFGDPDEDYDEVAVRCRTGTRVFRVPRRAPFRQLARTSSSLLALARTAARLKAPVFFDDSPLRRQQGALVAPLLRSGRYDAMPDAVAALSRLLADYDPALAPMGTQGRIDIELPKPYRLADEHGVRYPDIAVQARVSGAVTVEMDVDPSTGKVGRSTIQSRPLPLLDDAVLHAAPGWTVVPLPASGPVRGTVRFTIDRCVRGGLIERNR